MRIVYSALAIALLQALPATAQEVTHGRVATSAVGEAGQRQIKEKGVKGIKPMARLNSRIQNRVQSRVGNRIDRDYDPQANATSSFAVASDRVRTADKPRGN